MAGGKLTLANTRVLWTAEEAFPVFEELVLGAEQEVRAGFRIFDPDTLLQSDAARAVGVDWFDLIVWKLRQGVPFHLILSDFDPTARPGLHRETWASVRRFLAAGEASGRPDLLTVIAAMHSARVGPVPRLFLWPSVRRNLRETLAEIDSKPPVVARETLREMPGIASMATGEPGSLRPRRWPIPPLVPATHHQKLAVVDRRWVYVGGLDLNQRRYDTARHERPAEETWHDIQVVIDDVDTAAHAHQHLQDVLPIIAGQKAPTPSGPLLRTVSRKRSRNTHRIAPKTCIDELAQGHYAAARRARGLIHIETQFFRDRRFARILAERGAADRDLRLILIVPGAPEDVAFEGNGKLDARFGEYLQARCVEMVRAGFGDRAFVMAPAQPRAVPSTGRDTIAGAPMIYLHAKLAIFGEAEGFISSANINGRSFRWDTEAGVRLTDAALLSHVRRRCYAHWLPPEAGPEYYDPASAVAAWSALGADNLAREPGTRKGFVLPYPVESAKRFGWNVPGVPEEMV